MKIIFCKIISTTNYPEVASIILTLIKLNNYYSKQMVL